MTGETLKPASVKIAEKAYAVAETAVDAAASCKMLGVAWTGQSHKGVPLRGLMALNQAFFSLF
jgi:hypothetical protein